ncbi:hypothetical protein ACRAWF_25940 [Streptomyces sp. L7]
MRGILLIVGVFALQLGFVLSYIGAFHAPKPHHIPVAVVAPAQVSGQVVKQLNALENDPLDARAAATAKQARALILDRTVDAAVLIDPKGTTDTLLVVLGRRSRRLPPRPSRSPRPSRRTATAR